MRGGRGALAGVSGLPPRGSCPPSRGPKGHLGHEGAPTGSFTLFWSRGERKSVRARQAFVPEGGLALSFQDSPVSCTGQWLCAAPRPNGLSVNMSPSRLLSLPEPQFLQLYACLNAQSLHSYLTLCDSMDCVAQQALLSMGFPRQKSWSGLPVPSPRRHLNPGIKPAPLMSPSWTGMFFTTSTTWEAPSAV